MNKTVFKQAVRGNYKLFLVITAVLCLYLTIICAVFTPEMFSQIGMEGYNSMMSGMGNFGEMFSLENGFLSMIAQAYFGMIAYMFPMIYCIVTANKLIAAQVDRGSMAYTLAAPITRTKVTVTSFAYLVGSLVVMFAIVFGFGIIMGEVFQPGMLEPGKFFLITLGSFLLQFAIAGICFCSSCIFNMSKNSLAFGAGIPIAFFLFKMVSELSQDFEFFKYFTITSLFDTAGIINGENPAAYFLILAGIGLVTAVIGMLFFRRKDLPL